MQSVFVINTLECNACVELQNRTSCLVRLFWRKFGTSENAASPRVHFEYNITPAAAESFSPIPTNRHLTFRASQKRESCTPEAMYSWGSRADFRVALRLKWSRVPFQQLVLVQPRIKFNSMYADARWVYKRLLLHIWLLTNTSSNVSKLSLRSPT